jgi:hypothetical protein
LLSVSRVITEFWIVETVFHVSRKGNGAALADFLFDLVAESQHRLAIQVERGMEFGSYFFALTDPALDWLTTFFTSFTRFVIAWL